MNKVDFLKPFKRRFSAHRAALNQFDFHESSLYLITCITSLLILIFIPLRWMNGDIAQLQFNIFTLFMMFGINWCLINNKSTLAKTLFLIGVFAYLIISTFISGSEHIFWCYPITTLVFFILAPKLALVTTTLLIIVIGVIIFNELSFIEWVKVILSSQFNIFIAYIFCHKTHKHLNTLGAQALNDELSGLANRRSFAQTLEHFTNNRSPLDDKNSSYLLLLDIDNLKQINDTYGHIAGDETIKHFAQILKNNTTENEITFRLGGDEFAILINSTSAPHVLVTAEKLKQTIKDNKLILSQNEIKYTVSIGVAASTNNDREWYINADNALYQAKNNGKNKVIFFDG